MALPRTAMPERPAKVRARDFQEVNLGYTQVLAAAEAERCLQCKNPKCIDGCPVRVNIPRFIDLVAQGDLHGAAESLLDDNALPCVTGRVCPQETQCEALCLRGKKGDPVAIGGARTLRRRLGRRARRRAARHGPSRERTPGGDRGLGAGGPHRRR